MDRQFEESSPKGDVGNLKHFQGLSRPAQRENFKMDRLQQHIQSAGPVGSPKRNTRSQINKDIAEELEDGRTIQQLEESFASELGFCTAKLEDLKRSLSKVEGAEKPHGADDFESAERRRQERERAERERRLREQAKDARSPKRKIALKLEAQREAPPESLPELPIMVSSIHGVKGPETIAMVNVPALQAMCYPLNDGQSVESLLDLRNARDLAAKYETTQNVNMTDYVKINMKPHSLNSRAQVHSRGAKWNQQYELERIAAKDRRQNIYQQKIAGLIQDMRCRPPNSGLYHYDITDGQRTLLARGSTGMMHTGMLGVSSGVPGQMTPAGLWLTHFCAAAALGQLTAKYRHRKNIPNPEQERTPEEVAEAQRRRRHAMEQWSWVWRILKIWRSCHKAKRRIISIRVVKTFCRQMSEAARIKVGVMRFTKNVRNLQRACREFLNNKSKRVGEMNKLWCHVEDEYLAEYFRVFAAKIMNEEAKRRENDAAQKGYSVKVQKKFQKSRLAPR